MKRSPYLLAGTAAQGSLRSGNDRRVPRRSAAGPARSDPPS